MLTRGFVGECSENDPSSAWTSRRLSIRSRLIKLWSPLGLPPREYFFCVYSHSGLYLALIMYVKLYVRVLFPR